MPFAVPNISQGSPTLGGANVTLNWVAQTGSGPNGAGSYTSFNIFRNAGQIASGVSAGATTYVDNGGTGGVSYTYEIQGVYTNPASNPVISNDQTVTYPSGGAGGNAASDVPVPSGKGDITNPYSWQTTATGVVPPTEWTGGA